MINRYRVCSHKDCFTDLWVLKDTETGEWRFFDTRTAAEREKASLERRAESVFSQYLDPQKW